MLDINFTFPPSSCMAADFQGWHFSFLLHTRFFLPSLFLSCVCEEVAIHHLRWWRRRRRRRRRLKLAILMQQEPNSHISPRGKNLSSQDLSLLLLIRHDDVYDTSSSSSSLLPPLMKVAHGMIRINRPSSSHPTRGPLPFHCALLFPVIKKIRTQQSNLCCLLHIEQLLYYWTVICRSTVFRSFVFHTGESSKFLLSFQWLMGSAATSAPRSTATTRTARTRSTPRL